MTQQQPAGLYPYRAQVRFEETLDCTLARPPSVRVSAQLFGVSVTLSGELDLSTSSALDQCLRDVQAHNQRVVLDLRPLAFMDSTGLRAIFAARQRAAESGTEITILSAPGQVRRMLDLGGCDRLIDSVTPVTLTL